jgi:protein-S-isoprenylcysteine O-methyltransferase Ste14
MRSPSSHSQKRGTGWVVVQFALMAAILAAAPLRQGDWSGWWSWALGGVLLGLGAWVGVRGGRDLGDQRRPFPRPKDGGRLVTTGIYGRVRHPLYLSVILLGFAWALLWRSGPALAPACLQVLFLDAKARREERWLRDQFAEYAAYARRVKRFIPGLY